MNKIIDGVNCKLRDVVYSASLENQLEDKEVTYSWDQEEDHGQVFTFDDETEDRNYAELRDTQYAGMLPQRLVMLKRPIHMQLQELYRDHSRMYKSRGSKMKQEDIDILLDDFRYELHRIIAKAKDKVNKEGGNLDTILRVSAISGNSQELSRATKGLTMLFKRIEQAYTSYGYIPREFQSKLNDGLSVLISHFVMDVYGPELEKRKLESKE